MDAPISQVIEKKNDIGYKTLPISTQFEISFLRFLVLFDPFCANMQGKNADFDQKFFWDCFLCSFRWYEQIKMNRDFFYLIEFLLAQYKYKN